MNILLKHQLEPRLAIGLLNCKYGIILYHSMYSIFICLLNFYCSFSYSSDSIECQRLQARWETVGAKLKNRVNVARINRHIGGSMTARRFSINQSPTFILYVLLFFTFLFKMFWISKSILRLTLFVIFRLRRGVMYKYTSSDFTVESFLKFVEEDYKLTVKIPVPEPKSTLWVKCWYFFMFCIKIHQI